MRRLAYPRSAAGLRLPDDPRVHLRYLFNAGTPTHVYTWCYDDTVGAGIVTDPSAVTCLACLATRFHFR